MPEASLSKDSQPHEPQPTRTVQTLTPGQRAYLRLTEATRWLPRVDRVNLKYFLVETALVYQLHFSDSLPFTGALINLLNKATQIAHKPKTGSIYLGPKTGTQGPKEQGSAPNQVPILPEQSAHLPPREKPGTKKKIGRETQENQSISKAETITSPEGESIALRSLRQQYLLEVPRPNNGKTHIYSSVKNLFPEREFSISDDFSSRRNKGDYSDPVTGEITPYKTVEYQGKSYLEVVPPIDKPGLLERINFAVFRDEEKWKKELARWALYPDSIGELVVLVDGAEVFKGYPGDLLDNPDSRLKSLGATISHNDHEQGGGFSLFLPVSGRKIQVLCEHPEWMDVWIKYFDNQIKPVNDFSTLLMQFSDDNRIVRLKERPEDKIDLVGKKIEVSHELKEKGLVVEAQTPQVVQAIRVEIPAGQAEKFINEASLNIVYADRQTGVKLADLLGYMGSYQDKKEQFQLLSQHFVSHGLYKDDRGKIVFYFNYPVSLKSGEKITITGSGDENQNTLEDVSVFVSTQQQTLQQANGNLRLMFENFFYPDNKGQSPRPNIVMKGNVLLVDQIVWVLYDASQSDQEELDWTFPPCEGNTHIARIGPDGKQTFMALDGAEALVPGAGFHFIAPTPPTEEEKLWNENPMSGQTPFGGIIAYNKERRRGKIGSLYGEELAEKEEAVLMLNPYFESGGDTVLFIQPWAATFDSGIRSLTSREVRGLLVYYADENSVLFSGENAVGYLEIYDAISEHIKQLDLDADKALELQARLYSRVIASLGEEGINNWTHTASSTEKQKILAQEVSELIARDNPTGDILLELLEGDSISSDEVLSLSILVLGKTLDGSKFEKTLPEYVHDEIIEAVSQAQDKKAVFERALSYWLTPDMNLYLVNLASQGNREYIRLLLEDEKLAKIADAISEPESRMTLQEPDYLVPFLKQIFEASMSGKFDLDSLLDKYSQVVDIFASRKTYEHNFALLLLTLGRMTNYDLGTTLDLTNIVLDKIADQQDFSSFSSVITLGDILNLALFVNVEAEELGHLSDEKRSQIRNDFDFYIDHLGLFANEYDPYIPQSMIDATPEDKTAFRTIAYALINTARDRGERVWMEDWNDLIILGSMLGSSDGAIDIFNRSTEALDSFAGAIELARYFYSSGDINSIDKIIEQAQDLSTQQKFYYPDYLTIKRDLEFAQSARGQVGLEMLEYLFNNLENNPHAWFPTAYKRGSSTFADIFQDNVDGVVTELYVENIRKHIAYSEHYLDYYTTMTVSFCVEWDDLSPKEYEKFSTIVWQAADKFGEQLGFRNILSNLMDTFWNADELAFHLPYLDNIVQQQNVPALFNYRSLLVNYQETKKEGVDFDIGKALDSIRVFCNRPELAEFSEIEKTQLLDLYFRYVMSPGSADVPFFTNEQLDAALGQDINVFTKEIYSKIFEFWQSERSKKLFQARLDIAPLIFSQDPRDRQKLREKIITAYQGGAFKSPGQDDLWLAEIEHQSEVLQKLDALENLDSKQQKAVNMFALALGSRILRLMDTTITEHKTTDLDLIDIYLWSLGVPLYEKQLPYCLMYYDGLSAKDLEAIKPAVRDIIEDSMEQNNKIVGRFLHPAFTWGQISSLVRSLGSLR